MGKSGLSDKQINFIFYYLQNDKKNAAEAARKAGYSEKTAKQKANALLNDALVVACLHAHEHLNALVEKVNSDDYKIDNVDKAFVLKERLKVLKNCTKKVPLTEWDYNTHKSKEIGKKMLDPRSATVVLKDIEDSIEGDGSKWTEEQINKFFSLLES